jgi:iron-sulfur cluster repair protein YtfE (RIC family)
MVAFPKTTAETTVDEAKRQPGALNVLQRFGINHCCGAHLRLREAAAAAGVRVEAVLEALAAAGDRT